jgi:transmembrane sensor
MDKKEFQRQLIDRYVNNLATEEELEAFFHLLVGDELDGELMAYMEQEAGSVAVPQRKVRRLWPRVAVAASILLVLSAGAYFMLHKAPLLQQIAGRNDIAPGHNQATLTLANGQKIVLTKNLTGKLAEQGNVTVGIDAEKGITYTTSDQSDHTLTTMSYNTLTTKRGEASPYPLVLPDGTKVWLNAASSVTFPTAFYGKTREVTVTGEALFEVTHNRKQPFSVKTNNQLIEDIGTTFDVNAYEDEPVAKTTLVEGSVRVNGKTILKPGEQSELSGGNLIVSKVDVRDVIAWREGSFRFNAVKLGDILRQAARWYDVDVVYENEALKQKTFGVIGNRFAKISGLLHALEVTGEVKFKVEGRKITVLNK